MIAIIPPAAAVLGLAQTVADTVVTVSASPDGLARWADVLGDIARIVIAVALIVIGLALTAAALAARRLARRAGEAMQRFHGDVEPVLRHARDVAENVNYVSTAIRSDVEQFKRTLTEAQTRLTRAGEQAEQRINQFNALLEVVQEEAESLFIDTASTLRGVKAGARALKDGASEPAWDDKDADVAGPPARAHRQP